MVHYMGMQLFAYLQSQHRPRPIGSCSRIDQQHKLLHNTLDFYKKVLDVGCNSFLRVGRRTQLVGMQI